jgi:hypothetical protein
MWMDIQLALRPGELGAVANKVMVPKNTLSLARSLSTVSFSPPSGSVGTLPLFQRLILPNPWMHP